MYIWPSYNVAVTRQLLKIVVTAITGKGAEASKDVFAGLAVTIPLVSIRSIHQCLISALLPHYLFVVGNFIKHFYPFSFSYFLDCFSKHLCQFFILCFFGVIWFVHFFFS